MTRITKLTKTPFLVLLTILIAITVTSAYALTITLGGNVVITGSTDLDGTLLDAADSAGTNGQLLSSTGTGVAWVTSSSSATLVAVERLSGTISIAPGAGGSMTVNCLAGEIATGGGWEVLTGNGFPFIDFSGPELTGGVPTGWGVDIFNNDPGGAGQTITTAANVVCVKLT